MAKGFSFDALVDVLYPVYKTSLGAGSDLNSFNSSAHVGVYVQGFNSAAAGGSNYPVPYAGCLEVLPSTGGWVIQRYTVYTGDNATYVRSYHVGVWGVWKKYLTDNVIYNTVYPVGIVVTFAVEVNPNTAFPGTTWTRIIDTKQVRPSESAASVGTIGGSDTYTLTGANMPAHTHTVAAHTHVAPAHSHTINHDHANTTTKSAGAHTHTINPFARNGDGGNGKDNGNPYWIGDPANHTTSYSGDHTHVVDIPAFNGHSGSGGGSATSSAGGGNTGSAGNTTSFSTSGAWRKYGIWQRTA